MSVSIHISLAQKNIKIQNLKDGFHWMCVSSHHFVKSKILIEMIVNQGLCVFYIKWNFYFMIIHVSGINLKFFWTKELTLAALKLAPF